MGGEKALDAKAKLLPCIVLCLGELETEIGHGIDAGCLEI